MELNDIREKIRYLEHLKRTKNLRSYNLAFLEQLKDKEAQLSLHLVVCCATDNKKKNPYRLISYKQGWSEKRTKQNNSSYWKWEIEHNGFTL